MNIKIFRACTKNKNIALRRWKKIKRFNYGLYLVWKCETAILVITCSWKSHTYHRRQTYYHHFILILFLPICICFYLCCMQKRMRERTTISARQNKIPLRISPNFIKWVCVYCTCLNLVLFVPVFMRWCRKNNHFLWTCGRERENMVKMQQR